MLLSNVDIVQGNDASDLHIKDGRFVAIVKAQEHLVDADALSFNNAVAFPGIINSHDHLDFNLFPQLGDSLYEDYTEWAKHIHTKYKTDIDKVLKIPQALRVQWGLYKNLICGVTTVVNHGLPIAHDRTLIDVVQNYQSLHSVEFEAKWRLKLNNPFNLKQSVGIHTGEGISLKARNEIDQLINNNYLERRLIGIHGVAMTKQQASHFEALVWCPASNYFMFNNTAAVNRLKENTKIIFGSDSTLTAGWNIWQQIHLAQQFGLLTNEELFQSFTTTPATVWKLKHTGKIAQGFTADVVVANKKNAKSIDAALAVLPQDILLVLKKGNIKLFDESLSAQLEKKIKLNDYSKTNVEGSTKYIAGNIVKLMSDIKAYYPEVRFPISLDHSKEAAHAYAV